MPIHSLNSLTEYASSAATRYAFVGRHATFGQLPPQRVRSMRATRAPCSRDALAAASRAAEPAPMTMRSNLSAMGGSSQKQRLRYARAVENEASLVARLRSGDESAFRALIEMYHAMLVRVARMYVSSQAVAEEVAQETWLAVLRRDRSLRGALLAEDVDLSHPHEPGEDAGHPRGPLASLLLARGGRAGRRSRPLPRRRPRVAGALGRAAGGLSGRAAAGRRDARGDRAGDRRAPADPARGHLPARHRGLECRRSV